MKYSAQQSYAQLNGAGPYRRAAIIARPTGLPNESGKVFVRARD